MVLKIRFRKFEVIMEESKTKKKKISLATVLGDPAKAVTQLMEDPDIIAKFPEVLAKCPPAAMQILAGNIAQYLPPPTIEVEKVARATTDILRPLLQADIVKTINSIPKVPAPSSGNVDELAEIRKQLAQITSDIKAIQNDLPARIQEQMSNVLKRELETFQKQVVTQAKPIEKTAQKS